jgi:hypothetical protein
MKEMAAHPEYAMMWLYKTKIPYLGECFRRSLWNFGKNSIESVHPFKTK